MVDRFLKENIPQARFTVPEATYFAWVDMSRVLPDVEDLPLFFANNSGVLLEGGDGLFVDNAKGYIRLNLAMPRATIEEGLRRMAEAIKNTIDNDSNIGGARLKPCSPLLYRSLTIFPACAA